MTFLNSRLFCAFRGSWRKYERASSLELSLLRVGESGEGTQPPQGHLTFAHLLPRRDTGIAGTRAAGGPCTGNVRTVVSLLVPQSRSPGTSTPRFSPACSLMCHWPRSQRRSIQQVKHLPNWKKRMFFRRAACS